MTDTGHTIDEQTSDVVHILNNFETRSNKDIKLLMKASFEAGQSGDFSDFNVYMAYLKRLLEL